MTGDQVVEVLSTSFREVTRWYYNPNRKGLKYESVNQAAGRAMSVEQGDVPTSL